LPFPDSGNVAEPEIHPMNSLKPSQFTLLAALAVALAGSILTSPQAEASRRSGPGAVAVGSRVGTTGPKAGAVVRDHRTTTGKLQCVGSLCPGAKVNDNRGTTTGTVLEKCNSPRCFHWHPN
jgi:hypothetical protein